MNSVVTAMVRPLAKHEELHPSDLSKIGSNPDPESALLAALICVSIICAMSIIGLLYTIRRIRKLKFRPEVFDMEAQTVSLKKTEGGSQTEKSTSETSTQKNISIEGATEGTFVQRVSSVIQVDTLSFINA